MNVRPRILLSALAALALAGIGAPAASAASSIGAGPVQDPVAIGPNTYFTALVNGVRLNAVIKVACPVPLTAGEFGHPLEGQTVEVESVPPPTTADFGFTGSLADSIDAIFGPISTSSTQSVRMNFFFAPVDIPTSVWVPCSGSGVVTFAPYPGSPTAHSATVGVTYANITE